MGIERNLSIIKGGRSGKTETAKSAVSGKNETVYRRGTF